MCWAKDCVKIGGSVAGAAAGGSGLNGLNSALGSEKPMFGPFQKDQSQAPMFLGLALGMLGQKCMNTLAAVPDGKTSLCSRRWSCAEWKKVVCFFHSAQHWFLLIFD